MRCFRPENLMHEIKSFIVSFLDKRYQEPPSFDFVNIFNQTDRFEPILFMVGQNVNTFVELNNLRYLTPIGSSITIDYQSLGSLCNERIAKMIIRAAATGQWVLLDNLHLATDIIPNLHKFLDTMIELHFEYKKNLTLEFKMQQEKALLAKLKGTG